MPLKWESLSEDSSSGAQPAPPFGAPEGHFPDQLNNIQREALAAIAEIGSAVFGGGTAVAPSLSDSMEQLIYDIVWPVRSIRLWDSNSGATAIATAVPAGVTATWSPCDGTGGTPDLRDKIIAGADIASTEYTGNTKGSNTSASGGGHTPTGTIGGTALTTDQIPAHTHGVTDPGHTHTIAFDQRDQNDVPGTGGARRAVNEAVSEVTSSSTTGITIDSAGGGNTHTHTFTGAAVAAHTHTINPARTQVEFYMRTA